MSFGRIRAAVEGMEVCEWITDAGVGGNALEFAWCIVPALYSTPLCARLTHCMIETSVIAV